MTSSSDQALPLVIQGGMGIGVSSWNLARTVSMTGQLGVVSGSCIDTVFARRLQDGDPGGDLRRAMEAFPLPQVTAAALKRYFRPEGRGEGEPYRLVPMWKHTANRIQEELTMLASFAEVWLAREGHDGPVGMNLLTKIQMPNLATLYGAMLAGVDYVLMGAGIPKEIPGALDAFATHEPASLRLDLEGPNAGPAEEIRFDPRDHWEGDPGEELKRPNFLPIIAADSLAKMMVRKANGRVDGFIIEAPTAGGHNAPPRGKLTTNPKGEPIYGERDEVDLQKMAELGLPFWIAGGVGSPDGLVQALEAGAAGIQVGTLFAYSRESGLDPELRDRVLRGAREGGVDLHTDLRASPTGFPFKVVQLDGTNSEDHMYRKRERICDLGYLRSAYRREDGRVAFRCPSEPIETFRKKGGDVEETVGRKCLCNALMADVGHGQEREDGPERAILTSGDEVRNLGEFLGDREDYSAVEVLDYLLSGLGSDKEAPTTERPSLRLPQVAARE